MAKKTVNFNKTGAATLPTDKPVVYQIKTAGGKTNYVGVAKRGRAEERIQEHLDAGKIPGAKVQIQQVSSIAEARQKEQSIISKSQPKYNEQGKILSKKADKGATRGTALTMKAGKKKRDTTSTGVKKK